MRAEALIPLPSRRTHERCHRTIGLLAAAVLLVLAMSMASASTDARAAAPDTAVKEIAAAAAGEFRVEFVARKSPDESGMPTATVEVAGFVRRDRAWVPVGRRPVLPRDEGGAWFWNTVTDLGGVCELSVGDQPQPSAAITLSNGPSAGCAGSVRFVVDRGRLVDG
ncbi:MAG: hypothetical protein ACRDP8_13920 [Actinopolymorphaceae bacterium]